MKKDEAPIQGLSIDCGREVKLFARKSSRRFSPNGFGVYSVIERFDNTDLEAKVVALVRSIGFNGIFEIEFIEEKGSGVMYFLEINFRCTMSIHSYAEFGVNIPYLFAKGTLEGRIPLEEIHYSQKKDYHMMMELEDLKESVVHGSTSFWTWFRDFCSADSYLYIDKRDIRPFWALLYRKVCNAIRGMLGMKKY